MTVKEFLAQEHGRWLLTGGTVQYLIDLDAMTMTRIPSLDTGKRRDTDYRPTKIHSMMHVANERIRILFTTNGGIDALKTSVIEKIERYGISETRQGYDE